MSSVTIVPKPANAGSGQTAIANTKLAYVNVRNGPGTQYQDIADLRDNALVVYYPSAPQTDTQGIKWYWIESKGIRGWVASSVIQFEDAIGGAIDQDPTPYDGSVAIWHWRGDGIPENTIEEFVATIKNRAPNVKQIWVKTSDGSNWMGDFDRSTMAIDGVAAVDRWVSVLEANGLEFHAWCVPQGLDIARETALIAAVCKRPGVKSMILDVEPYAGFWQGGKDGVRPYMLALRRQIGGSYHVGMSIDPRPWHYDSVFPEEWLPFINSIHPQSYWFTFRDTPEQTLQQTYDTWGGYGKPIIPALQGDAALIDMEAAHTLATQRYGASGLSWWRYGVISQFGAVNLPVEIQNPGEDPQDPVDNFADEILIKPGEPGFRGGTYTGETEFSTFEGTWNWTVLYKETEPSISTVWTEYKAVLPQSGRYEIATFVPARHATTSRARFKVHGIRGTSTEVVIDINQGANRNLWVPLGIFDLDKNQPNAGKVFLNDVTGESDKEIAFDAVRFRRIVTTNPDPDPTDPEDPSGGSSQPDPTEGDRPSIIDGVPVADGYDSPIGTAEQRAGDRIWPQGWLDASPFGRLYFVGTPSEAYHTGADLNFGSPYEDKGMPTYSVANGMVIFAGPLKIWGNVIIIRHDPLYVPSGQVLYSRYAHVQDILVKVGDRVKRGQEVAEIGDAFGRFVPHLHYDLSPTTIFERSPGDWPGTNQARLLANYIDPLLFIRGNRP